MSSRKGAPTSRLTCIDQLKADFNFADFKQAFAFMSEVALHAEVMGHHPEWSNVFRTVEVTLATHDVGGVSALDAKLARKMDSLLAVA